MILYWRNYYIKMIQCEANVSSAVVPIPKPDKRTNLRWQSPAQNDYEAEILKNR